MFALVEHYRGAATPEANGGCLHQPVCHDCRDIKSNKVYKPGFTKRQS